MRNTPKKIKKDMTIDDLAVLVAKGFGSVDEHFEQLEQSVENKLKKLDQKIDQRFEGLARRIDDLAMNRSTREETKILEMRVDRIEKALKIK